MYEYQTNDSLIKMYDLTNTVSKGYREVIKVKGIGANEIYGYYPNGNLRYRSYYSNNNILGTKKMYNKDRKLEKIIDPEKGYKFKLKDALKFIKEKKSIQIFMNFR